MLELKHIYKKIDHRLILKDISLTLPNRGFIGIQGESGCGKSTLLYIIGMLDSDYEGEILYNDEVILNKKRFIQNHISYMMQNKDYISSMTVKENIVFPCYISQKSFQKGYLKKITRQLHIDHLLNHYPHQLSGGQLKRVSIAKALLKQSSILLCDEPTGALHENQAKEVMKLLKKVSENKLVIIVSHDTTLLEEYCDHVLTLENGQLTSFDLENQEAVCLPSQHQFHFLSIYSIRQLLYQRNKLLFLFLFQVIIICAIFFMITAYHGLLDALYQSETHSVQAHIMTIEKRDQVPFEFFPNIQYSNIDYHYQLEQFHLYSQDQSLSSSFQFLPHYTDHIQLISGALPQKDNEIIVSDSLYQTLKDRETIHIVYGDVEMDLFITGVISPFLFQEHEIYCLDSLKERFAFLKDDYVLDAEVDHNHTLEIYQSLSKDYIVTSDVIERIESYQSILSFAKSIAFIFISMSLFVSLLLIGIVESILYSERRHDVAYLLSLGISHHRLFILSIIEGVALGLILVVMGSLLATGGIIYFNDVFDMMRHFYFEFQFDKLWFCEKDIYIILGFIYIFMTIIGGIGPIKTMMTIDMIDILREE